MTPPTVDVIIVNYNTRDRTLECLESVFAQRIEGLSVIVARQRIGRRKHRRDRPSAHPSATVIDIGENVGFARGVNRGSPHSITSRVRAVVESRCDGAARIPGVRSSSSQCTILLTGCTEDARSDRMASLGIDLPVGEHRSLWSLLCFATGLSTAFRRLAESSIPSRSARGSGIRCERCRSSQDASCWSDDVTGTGLGAMDERFFLYGEDAEFSAPRRLPRVSGP